MKILLINYNVCYCYLCRIIDKIELERIVLLELKSIKPIVSESVHTSFVTEELINIDCVKQIQICEIENVLLEDDNVQQILNQVWFCIIIFNIST